VIEGLERQLREPVRFNFDVATVDYSGEACVLTSRGGEQTVTADMVVVTLPLGVLKSSTVDFVPALPAERTQAVERLGFGLLNKITAEFDSPFWRDDPVVAGAGGQPSYLAYASDTRGELFLTLDMTDVLGRPVLMSLLPEGRAALTERSTDEEVLAWYTGVLRRIFGEERVGEVRSYNITRWGGDPFALGSYSFVAKGSSGDDFDELACPVADKLFFAGEATSREYPSSVHGAYLR
jgi:monoamine oxidase